MTRRSTFPRIGGAAILLVSLSIGGPIAWAVSGLPAGSKGYAMGDSTLEEGKALYENGQYLAALSKFMAVLRRDPHEPEARRYLRKVMDEMRQSPGKVRRAAKDGAGSIVTQEGQEDLRQLMRRRSVFTLDLKAIPGVQVDIAGNVAQVQIDTSKIFTGDTGALQEEAIPTLDRVAAWLKTFGQQPVIIHCYPEETLDPGVNGSLFISRYSEIYNFFVEERKLDPKRFLSTDLLTQESPDEEVVVPVAGVLLSTNTPRIVIETLGSQSALLDAMPAATPRHAVSRWLEISLEASRSIFNPEEGEWVNLDIAALTRTGVRNWNLTVLAGEGSGEPVYKTEGTGNILRRISWNGQNSISGSLVPSGSYLARFSATDDDGKIMSRDVKLQVTRSGADAVLVQKPKEDSAAKSKKKTHKKKAAAKPAEESSPVAASAVAVPAVAAAAASAPPAAAPTMSTAKVNGSPVEADVPDAATLIGGASASPADSEDGVHAIWKQPVQFDPGQSELKQNVKSSLERISKTLEVYPLQKVRIMGFAMTSEPNALALAKKRAEVVRAILVDEYHVAPKRVIVGGGKTTSEAGGSKVEMSITN